MRPTMRAYSHQGHGPRADQTGRIHISDFRNPRTISIAKRSRSIHWVKLRSPDAYPGGRLCPQKRTSPPKPVRSKKCQPQTGKLSRKKKPPPEGGSKFATADLEIRWPSTT